MEVRTTQLFSGWLWKQGRMTKMWVRRFYCLIRREQIDEMVGAATNILHELCTFDSDSDHAECLGSIILEEVVRFDTGIDAGLPDHVKAANVIARQAAGSAGKRKFNLDSDSNKRTFFSLVADMFPVRVTCDEWEDYTIELVLTDRSIRFRAETKSTFDSWSTIFTSKIPKVRASPSFEGWMWRRKTEQLWEQSYALLLDGVLFFFQTIEAAEIFKVIAPRDEDSVFLASKVSDDMICLENCTVVQAKTWEGQQWVLNFKIEEFNDYASVVDEANSDAWTFAVRNARHWFETIPDDHPTRRLFGGLGGGDDDGPMLAQHTNPIAERKREEERAREAALGAAKSVDPALANLMAKAPGAAGAKGPAGAGAADSNNPASRFGHVSQAALMDDRQERSGGSGIDGFNIESKSVQVVESAQQRQASRQPARQPSRAPSRIPTRVPTLMNAGLAQPAMPMPMPAAPAMPLPPAASASIRVPSIDRQRSGSVDRPVPPLVGVQARANPVGSPTNRAAVSMLPSGSVAPLPSAPATGGTFTDMLNNSSAARQPSINRTNSITGNRPLGQGGAGGPQPLRQSSIVNATASPAAGAMRSASPSAQRQPSIGGAQARPVVGAPPAAVRRPSITGAR